MLSELNLIANSSYSGFEAHKLHLLFQSACYLNTGNYKSATRQYRELISLFEENKHLIQNTPIYYLSALIGILDSLHAAWLYYEMPFFLSILKNIGDDDYSSEFLQEVRTRLFLYELARFIGIEYFNAAYTLLRDNEDLLIKKITLFGSDMQLRIYLYSAVTYMCCGELANACKSMKKIFCSDNLFHTFPLYKTARLICLLIQAELRNYDFFDNEISSIKRSIHYDKQVYATEKLLFRFVKAYPLPSYKKNTKQVMGTVPERYR